MSRRSFLSLLGAAATSAVVAPTYFFAPKGGWQPKLAPRTYSFADVNSVIYTPNFDLTTAIGEDLDAIGRIAGFFRRPPMYSERGLIIQNPESDHSLRTRITEELATRRYIAL